jgi:CheY-like chemotaxis protein
VGDTGSGMDETTLARAVEPFFSTKEVGKGTGLGLSMVHGLASQLGGRLDILSRPGAGTTVDLWLQISVEPVEMAIPQARTTLDTTSLGVALLVDDEALVRMGTANMLVDLGYEVVESSSAEKALRLLEEGLHIDVLITDHLMHGMTGGELARRVNERGVDFIPVLILSGFTDAKTIPAELSRLAKPFVQADLAASLAGLGASGK